MGASSWEYVVPYKGSVATTLAALHKITFQQHHKEGDDFASIEELWNDEEFMGTVGTHSILDIMRVDSTKNVSDPWSYDDLNVVRPLAADRILHWFGTDRPSVAMYEAVRDGKGRGHGGPYGDWQPGLMDEAKVRWTGAYLLLYTGDEPTHVAFWGWSGD